MTITAPNPAAVAAADEPPDSRRSVLHIVRAFVRRQPLGTAGLLIVLVMFSAGAFADWIAPYDPEANDFTAMMQAPSWEHVLGTDQLGRNVLAGIFHGARVSLVVGLIATALGLAFGVLVGSVAGYFGGWVDDLAVRFIEIFQTLPGFVLLVVLVFVLQPTATTVTFGIAIVSWPLVARLTRAEFRAIREKDEARFPTVLSYVLDYERRFELRYQTDIYQDLLPSQLAALVEHLHLTEHVRKVDIARYIGVSPATLRNYTGLWRLLQRGGLFAQIVELMDAILERVYQEPAKVARVRANRLARENAQAPAQAEGSAAHG